jgi:hypothetical protein
VTSDIASTATVARPERPRPPRPGRSTPEPKRSRARRNLWIVLVVAAVSFVATLVATMRYGIGLTPDSFVYLNGARSLATGHGYTSDGSAITSFAPGYSAVLSLSEHFGVAVASAARGLAAVSFAASVVLGYLLLCRHIRSRRIIIGATVAIGCSAVLLQTFKEALSEHLFVVVVLLFILVAEELMRSPRALVPLATLVVLTWAAFYLRYAGIIFVPIAAGIVLLALWRVSRRRALVRAAVVLVAGFVLPAVWMKRNVDAGTGLLGARQDAAASLLTNIARTSRELSSWMATTSTPAALRVVLFAAVVAVVATGIVLIARGRYTLPSDAIEIVPLVLVASTYLIYLTLTASLVAFAAINTRFMSPVFIPFVVIAAWVFERARQQVSDSLRTVMTVIAVAWLAISLVWFGGQMVSSARNGAGGYATKRWHNSKVITDVRRIDPSAPTYTNDSAAIELFTGRVVDLSVAKTFFASNEETGALASFLHSVRCAGKVELVWFLPNGRPRLYSPDELSQHLHVVPRVTRGDGVIYDVTPKPGDARPSNCR